MHACLLWLGGAAASRGGAGMAAVRAHAFFEGLDGDQLYTQPPPHLAGGAAPPQPRAQQWSLFVMS